METGTYLLLTVLLMGLVTALPRIIPVWILAGRRFPKEAILWLKYVPIAVMSAMIFPELLLDGQKFNLSFANLELWSALPTILVAVLSRSLIATIMTGMATLAFLRLIF